MDPIPLVIGLVVFLIALSVIFSVVKGIIKIVFLVLTIIGIVLVINGVSVSRDLMDFKENFPTAEKKIILEDNGNILTGLVMKGENEDPVFFTQEDIDNYSGYLKDEDYDAVIEDSYKLMIVDIEALEELPKDTIEIDGEDFTKEFVVSVLRSEDPNSLLVEEIGEEVMFFDAIQLKAGIFGMTFNEISQNPIYFFGQYKEGNILIYPETAIFKVIKYMPLGLVKSIMEKAITNVGQNIPIQRGA